MFLSLFQRYLVEATCKLPWCLRDRIGRIQTQTPTFDDFIWVFRDGRHKDCLLVARDVLFQRMLPGAMGMPPPKTREYTKKMIIILEHGTHELKERWIGHFHSAEGAWSKAVPCDPTHPDDQTQGDIRAVACFELNIKASSKGNSK